LKQIDLFEFQSMVGRPFSITFLFDDIFKIYGLSGHICVWSEWEFKKYFRKELIERKWNINNITVIKAIYRSPGYNTQVDNLKDKRYFYMFITVRTPKALANMMNRTFDMKAFL
jgi:hypothetical protein